MELLYKLAKCCMWVLIINYINFNILTLLKFCNHSIPSHLIAAYSPRNWYYVRMLFFCKRMVKIMTNCQFFKIDKLFRECMLLLHISTVPHVTFPWTLNFITYLNSILNRLIEINEPDHSAIYGLQYPGGIRQNIIGRAST